MDDPDARATAPGDADERRRAARVEELRRRILEVASDDEAAYGDFTTADWVVCVTISLVLPLALIWWFA